MLFMNLLEIEPIKAWENKFTSSINHDDSLNSGCTVRGKFCGGEAQNKLYFFNQIYVYCFLGLILDTL